MSEYQNNTYNGTPGSGVLDWGDEITNENSFTLLPEGDYRFTIEKFERARHSGSDKIPPCHKAVVTFTVYAPEGFVSVTENYILHQKMEWKLSEFFASIGMKKKGEPVRMRWTPELIGKQGVCRLIVHKYTKDGQNREINRIDKLYPSYDQPYIQQNVQQNTYSTPVQTYQQPVQGWTQGQF